MLRRQVGRRLRVWRKQQGFTLRQLAGDMGISKSTISRIEKGEHGLNDGLLEMLATTMGTSIPSLCGGSDGPALVVGQK